MELWFLVFNLILVGPMGAGKSTIGRLLSREINILFKDLDKEIEEKAGANIPWIFDVEGEEGFRSRESSILIDLCKFKNIIIATGGGVVLKKKNRDLISKTGQVIYLRTSIEQMILRTSSDKNRPLLNTSNRLQVIKEIMTIREPLYSSVADLVIDTDNKTPYQLVKELLKKIG